MLSHQFGTGAGNGQHKIAGKKSDRGWKVQTNNQHNDQSSRT
jgi:hypothetical protein